VARLAGAAEAVFMTVRRGAALSVAALLVLFFFELA
jgi:hypothetical protein